MPLKKTIGVIARFSGKILRVKSPAATGTALTDMMPVLSEDLKNLGLPVGIINMRRLYYYMCFSVRMWKSYQH